MGKKNKTLDVKIQGTRYEDGEIYRICPKCKEEKPLDKFGFRKKKDEGGLIRNQSQCKKCR